VAQSSRSSPVGANQHPTFQILKIKNEDERMIQCVASVDPDSEMQDAHKRLISILRSRAQRDRAMLLA
jgi:hypothetical protein